MKKLSFWIGLLSVTYAGLYIIGFLPVGVWQYILDLFIDREPNAFYKIVPAEGEGCQSVIASLVGLGLIIYAKMPFKKSATDN